LCKTKYVDYIKAGKGEAPRWKKIDGRKQLAEMEEFLEAGKEKECDPQRLLTKEHIGKVLEGLSRKHAEEKNEWKLIQDPVPHRRSVDRYFGLYGHHKATQLRLGKVQVKSMTSITSMVDAIVASTCSMRVRTYEFRLDGLQAGHVLRIRHVRGRHVVFDPKSVVTQAGVSRKKSDKLLSIFL
jgi:hypothetical protein